jgi:hypothetical protein
MEGEGLRVCDNRPDGKSLYGNAGDREGRERDKYHYASNLYNVETQGPLFASTLTPSNASTSKET